ncbi:50S ribosomal protein L5 [Candidatus Gracilibacteria bacterium]|nr:50S ribosomal protein L5 [Candidatus Gracilibacteria bacterium]
MPKAKKEQIDFVKELQNKLNIKNVNAVPKVEKVILSCGIGSLVTRKGQKDFGEFENNLKRISGQKARMIKSRKSISNFKLREGMPVMLQSTLRKKRAVEFLDRFVKLVLPRMRDFSGISSKSFDPSGVLNIGIPNYNIFPELGLDDVTIPMGIQITIVTSSKNIEQSKALLEALGFVFKL